MLGNWILRASARNPDGLAIVQGRIRISWSDLSRRVDRCAAGLAALGVEAADVVALVLSNRPEFVVAFFAAMRLGAIVAPTSPGVTHPELERQLADAQPRVLICERGGLPMCAAVGKSLPHPPHLVVADDVSDRETGDFGANGLEALGSGVPYVPDRGTPASRALYLYTSGSTDSFKRVCCSQSNLYAEAANFVSSTRQTEDDTIFCAVPLCHSYGIGNGLLDAAFTGATLVLEENSGFPFATRVPSVLERLSAEKVRVFLGVPFQYEVLARSDADVASAFAGVRWCVSSGDTLPRRVFEAFRQRTGRPVRSLYGSTEAGSIAMHIGEDAAVEFGDLGRPLANVEIEARGETGELWVKSPAIPATGYDNRPDLNAVMFRDGFYNSGDLGRIDARGHLWMTGRKQSFVDIGGRKVDVSEVEEVLLSHPKVREAAVVGVAVAGVGQSLKAVLAADEFARESDILDHCRGFLAPHKVPRLIEFRQALPRSPLGKVLKSELQQAEDWLAKVPSARDVPPGSRASRIAWLARRIQEQVAAVLNGPPDDVPRNRPFQDLGFDSLDAVELQERLSHMSGLALSIVTLWNYPSIDTYAAFLLDAMTWAETDAERPAPGTGPPKALHGTIDIVPSDELDAISDEGIAALLANELSPGHLP